MNRFTRRNGIHLLLITAISLGIIMLTSLGVIMNTASAQDGKPTVVLVHGAFAESSSWNGVLTKLIAKGYPTVAVANPLRGVKSDANYVASVLTGIKGSIVLVGHSYGGAVITEAVNGNKNVKALVYVAGFAPNTGETAAKLSGRYPVRSHQRSHRQLLCPTAARISTSNSPSSRRSLRQMCPSPRRS
jgi:pimeloyl-ACP methyl ester carboxylesterase